MIDEQVNSLDQIFRKELLSVPPIVIASSLPTFLLQKYLESYPVTALFMIDPFPPNPFNFRDFYKKKLSEESENIPPALHLLYHQVITDSNQRVNLEANSVPMFPVFFSTKDQTKKAIEKEFIEFHGIDEEQILRLPHSSSLEQLLSVSNSSDLRIFHDFLLLWSEATM